MEISTSITYCLVRRKILADKDQYFVMILPRVDFSFRNVDPRVFCPALWLDLITAECQTKCSVSVQCCGGRRMWEWIHGTCVGSGEEEEQLEQMMEAAGLEAQEELLQCFRCDLGFWDACYTTETNCSLGDRCFTGRGKAGALRRCLVWKAISSITLTLSLRSM